MAPAPLMATGVDASAGAASGDADGSSRSGSGAGHPARRAVSGPAPRGKRLKVQFHSWFNVCARGFRGSASASCLEWSGCLSWAVGAIGRVRLDRCWTAALMTWSYGVARKTVKILLAKKLLPACRVSCLHQVCEQPGAGRAQGEAVMTVSAVHPHG